MKKNNITKFTLRITDIEGDSVTFELATESNINGKSITLESQQFTDFAIRLAANVYVDSEVLSNRNVALLETLRRLWHLRLNIFDGKDGDSVFTTYEKEIGDEREKWLRQEKDN